MMPFSTRILRAIFPRRCIYCDHVIYPEERACTVCAPTVPRMEDPVCPLCGCTRSLCRCRHRRHAYDRCITAMRYEDGAEKAVLKLKYTQDADLVDTMVEEMVAVLRARTDAAALDVVTGIPMRKKELYERGYNQSELLAKGIAKAVGIPYEPLLTKIFDTRSQKELPGIERSGNLLGAFDVVHPVAGRRVLIIDDLITTGSTLHEASKMLKLYGASSVTALTFAATLLKDKEDETDDTDAQA